MNDERLSKLQQRVVEAHVQATESALDLFGVFDFPGTPRDIYGDVDGLQPVPPGGIPPYYWNNQGRGEVLPVYTTWLQLKYIRDRSRRLCRENPFAICATENRKNYIVGDGFTYRATGRAEELNTAAQQLLDTWATAIELSEYELDGMERLDMDGEFFLRFFYRESGLLEIRFVEPEHVKDIGGDPWSPADSFGVKTHIDDVENIKGYQVIEQPWNSDNPTLVPADDIMHVKLNVPRNAKRGLPTFYPVESNLRRANKLLASMAAMAETRAKIALIRKLLNATGSAAANMVNSLKTGTITDQTTNQSVTLERMPYSSILTSTGNVEYDMPGANVDASGFVEVLQAELRGICSRLQMPEWMLTSNSDATNYNQAFVSESHAVKAFRRVQRMLCRRFGESRHMKNKSVAWRQIEYAVERGLLDPATLQEVQIQCEGPSLIARDKVQEAETNKMYLEMGIKSKSTISQEIGVDREQELDNINKESTARVENANITGPVAVRQQESTQDRKPGELDPVTKNPYEPEAEPDMNEYVYNKFKSMYGDQDEPDKSTGYLLRNGQPIKMGSDTTGQTVRLSHHKEGLPSRSAMERWGWETPMTMPGRSSLLPPSPPTDQLKYKGDALGELLDKSHMIRTHVGNDHISFEYSHPLNTSQKRVIRNFVLERKPGEVVFSRRLPEQDKHAGVTNPSFHHKILPWHEVDDYLNGVQESVQEENDGPDYEGLVRTQALSSYGKSKQSMNPATGFLTRRGEPIDIGAFNSGSFADVGDANEHADFAPTDEEQQKWGWPKTHSNTERLNELMKRSGLARVRLMNNGNTLAVHHALPLTTGQKEELHSFVLHHKPTDIFVDYGKRTTTLKPDEVEEYLYGTQESVKRVTETKDQQGASHSPTHGQYVQPEFGPEFPMLMDPMAKQEYANRKTIAMQQDYMQAAQAHAENLNKLQQAAYVSEKGEAPAPEELEALNKEVQKSMQNVRKAWDAFQTSSQESKELASGPMKPDLPTLDRMLTSGPIHIISAGRNSNHPDHKNITPEEFAERHKQLGNDLTKQGYKFAELNGKYGGLEEPSYLVQAGADHAHVIRTLGYKYGQESVIHSANGKNQLAFVTGPSSNTAHHGTGFSYLPDAEDNYSEYDDGKGNKAKFALNLDFNESHQLESVKVTEAVAPQTGRSGFSAGDFRDMLQSYLPATEDVEDTHDPNDVSRFFHELSNTLKARTGHTLPEVLKDHRHGNLHSNAGEAVIAAIHGGPFEGHTKGGWDSHKRNKSGVMIGADSKMTADPDYKNRRLKLDSGTINDMQNRVAKTGAFPILFGFNPGLTDKGGMIVAHKGAVNFPTRDTPNLQEKVEKGDAAVLAKFQDVGDFLKDPGAIASAQEAWKRLANTVKPKHLSTALDEFQHKQSVNYFRRLNGLAQRGDKTALSKLKDFGLV